MQPEEEPAAPCLEQNDVAWEDCPPSGRLNPGLHLVATPIGNLRDITLRALDTLRAADFIACEDTRHSGIMLKHHQVSSRLVSMNEHNEAVRIPQLIDHIRQGGSVALISDAGAPAVSDPGQRLVSACVAAGLHVEGIPGPSAVLTALTASGLPTTPFYFGGFLPHKKGARTTVLTAAIQRDCTSVFFESPYRIVDTLAIIAEEYRQTAAWSLPASSQKSLRNSGVVRQASCYLTSKANHPKVNSPCSSPRLTRPNG